MFPSSLRASLAILIASAVAVSATPSLTIKTSTPNVNVDGLENLKVTTTIVNTGDETLKLLNNPRGVLSPFPENTFIIINPVGSRPLFTGPEANYNPTYAAGLEDPSIFTVLAAGASIDIIHDLSAAYNFTQSGAGNYSIEPSNLFTYIDVDGTPKDFHATIEDIAEVKLSGNLAVSRVHDKRVVTGSCSLVQQSQLFTAAIDANAYVSNAYSYINGVSDDRPRYNTWFGTYSPLDGAIVQGNLGQINSRDFSGDAYIYDCSCTDNGITSYIFSNDRSGRIYLCGGFWPEPATGTDSKAGTLIHEASRFDFNGGTQNYVFGRDNCANLAYDDPYKAISNAANYKYFAENNPALMT